MKCGNCGGDLRGHPVVWQDFHMHGTQDSPAAQPYAPPTKPSPEDLQAERKIKKRIVIGGAVVSIPVLLFLLLVRAGMVMSAISAIIIFLVIFAIGCYLFQPLSYGEKIGKWQKTYLCPSCSKYLTTWKRNLISAMLG